MKLIGLVCLTMVAFAANSILTRVGVNTYGMDPITFTVIRVGAGALSLGFLVIIQGQSLIESIRKRWKGALALTTYMIGFSIGYLSLGCINFIQFVTNYDVWLGYISGSNSV